jgi:phosphatidylglycerophosphate synthase
VRVNTAVGEFAGVAGLLGVGTAIVTAFMPGAALFATLAACLCFALASALAAGALHRHYPHPHLGLCNVVTLMRLALTMVLVAPLVAGSGASWFVFGVATIALTLDGFDGWLARRHGKASTFGARFDMEVDSVLALILAASAALGSGAGAAAILLGLPRYIFAAAAWAFPWMRREVPERLSRKCVCVLQLGALIALQAPILPDSVATILVPVVAGGLAVSFAVDVVWLWRRRACKDA